MVLSPAVEKELERRTYGQKKGAHVLHLNEISAEYPLGHANLAELVRTDLLETTYKDAAPVGTLFQFAIYPP